MNKSRLILALFVLSLGRIASATSLSERWRDPVAAGVVALERGAGGTLVELNLEGSPSARTLSPRLARAAAGRRDLAHRALDLGSFDSALAERLAIDAVPAFFFYRGRRLVARGVAALEAFHQVARAPTGRDALHVPSRRRGR